MRTHRIPCLTPLAACIVLAASSAVASAQPALDVQRPAATSIAAGATDEVGVIASTMLLHYTLANTGTADLVISKVSLASDTHANASILNTATGTIAAGANTKLCLWVAPSHWTWSVELTVGSNDAGTPTYTITLSGNRPMSGTYTINNGQPASMTNFVDFGVAFDALEASGVDGPVTFDVYDDGGVYTANASYGLGITSTSLAASGGVVAGTSETNRIVIRAAPGESPIIDGTGDGLTYTNFGGNSGCMLIRQPWVTVDGLTFRNGTNFGLVAYGWANPILSDVTFRNCRAHDIDGTGIGMYHDGGVTFERAVIENCVVWNCTGGAFDGFLQGALFIRRPGTGSIMRHNTVIAPDNMSPGRCAFGANTGAASSHVMFLNNIVIMQAADCPLINIGPLLTLYSEGNVYYFDTNSPGDFASGNTSNGTGITAHDTFASWQGATLDISGVLADPLLTDAAGVPPDVTLQPGSPAIDRGYYANGPAHDIAGNARPRGAGPDAGAFEFASADAPGIQVEAGEQLILNSTTLTGRTTGLNVPMPATFQIRNIGTAPLTISGATFANEVNMMGSVTSTPTTIPVGDQAELVIGVMATATPWSFDLVILNNSPNNDPFTISFEGTAAPAANAIMVTTDDDQSIPHAGAHNIGTALVGKVRTFTFHIRNYGTHLLNLTSNPTITLGTPSNATAVVATHASTPVVHGGGSATFSIDVTPTLNAYFFVPVTITSDNSTTPTYSFTIDGTGLHKPHMEIWRDGTQVTKGDIDDLGAISSTKDTTVTYTIRNTGTVDLTLTGVPAVAIDAGCVDDAGTIGQQPNTTVPAGGEVTFDVTISPTRSGVYFMTVSIASNDTAANPFSFAVLGTASSAQSSTKKGGCGVLPDGRGGTVLALAALLAVLGLAAIRRRLALAA